VTRYRNGDAFTSTQVYYERVNSHTAGCAFNFTNCGLKDVTKVVTGLEDYQATKIRFSKQFSFLHPDAKFEFENQRNQFFLDNERRDDYMETREGLDLLNVNFKEYMIAFKDPDNLPWYVSNVVFWIASFLLISWPLRIFIDFKTAYIHYHVHKIFGVNYVNSGSGNSSHIPRANTIASIDLENIVRNNFTIVPSYSQALLMNDSDTSNHMLHDANANITSPEFGPTRSITWNNISQSASSGYISGFFSSANIPTSPSVDQQTPRQRTHSASIHRSLRDLLRSPWTRHKQRNNTRSQTMFILSSPDSVDEYSVSVDQQLMSANLSRNYSSFNDLSSRNSSINNIPHCSKQFQSGNSVVQLQQHLTLSGETTCREHATCASVMETISETNKRNGITENHSSASQTVRPMSIAFGNDHQCSDSPSQQTKSLYLKSNLPKVPIPEILSESKESVNIKTPSSPPCYEDALGMQRPSNEALYREPRTSRARGESRSLLTPGTTRGQTRYNTLMETSL